MQIQEKNNYYKKQILRLLKLVYDSNLDQLMN